MQLTELPNEMLQYEIFEFLGIYQLRLRIVCKLFKSIIDQNCKKNKSYHIVQLITDGRIEDVDAVNTLYHNGITYDIIEFMSEDYKQFDIYENILIQIMTKKDRNILKWIWDCNIGKLDRPYFIFQYTNLYMKIIQTFDKINIITNDKYGWLPKNYKKWKNDDVCNIISINEVHRQIIHCLRFNYQGSEIFSRDDFDENDYYMTYRSTNFYYTKKYIIKIRDEVLSNPELQRFGKLYNAPLVSYKLK